MTAGRVVALTVVDAGSTLPIEWVNEILSLTVRLRGVDAPGIPTILDVLHTGRCGVVVADWVAGGSLREVADTGPAPEAAAAAFESLAMAAEAAHRAGMHLSIDHPTRVRISSDGRAVLAFPATLPDGTPQSDLRGIGGCLYAVLCWPKGDGRVLGFPYYRSVVEWGQKNGPWKVENGYESSFGQSQIERVEFEKAHPHGIGLPGRSPAGCWR